MHPLLTELIHNLTDGDGTLTEVELPGATLDAAETFLAAHPEYHAALPFPQEDATYRALLATDAGALALQSVVNMFC